MRTGMNTRMMGLMLAAGMTATAWAVPLPPGSNNVPLAGTTAAAEPDLASVNIASVVRPFEIFSGGGALLFRGQLAATVSRSINTGTLIFSYRILNTQGGLNGVVARVEAESFAGFAVDANWRADGLGMSPPNQADRSGSGSVINYEFLTPPLFSGSTSRFFYAFTDATEFNTDGLATIYLSSGEFATVRVFAPGAPCETCRGDVNGDGVVNFQDLNEVLTNFGAECNPPASD